LEFVDLSHFIHSNMPVFPGTPEARVEILADIADDGFREKILALTSHTGTHLDAPAHVLESGKTLDDYPVSAFFGSAVTIDLSRLNNPEIPAQVIPERFNETSVDFVLFYTGWAEKWGSEEYFQSAPYFNEELAQRLSVLGLKGVGIDAPSVDALDSESLPVHRILLRNDLVILENLCCLEKTSGKGYHLAVFPLKIQRADGAPVRAVAIIGEEA